MFGKHGTKLNKYLVLCTSMTESFIDDDSCDDLDVEAVLLGSVKTLEDAKELCISDLHKKASDFVYCDYLCMLPKPIPVEAYRIAKDRIRDYMFDIKTEQFENEDFKIGKQYRYITHCYCENEFCNEFNLYSIIRLF